MMMLVADSDFSTLFRLVIVLLHQTPFVRLYTKSSGRSKDAKVYQSIDHVMTVSVRWLETRRRKTPDPLQ